MIHLQIVIDGRFIALSLQAWERRSLCWFVIDRMRSARMTLHHYNTLMSANHLTLFVCKATTCDVLGPYVLQLSTSAHHNHYHQAALCRSALDQYCHHRERFLILYCTSVWYSYSVELIIGTKLVDKFELRKCTINYFKDLIGSEYTLTPLLICYYIRILTMHSSSDSDFK